MIDLTGSKFGNLKVLEQSGKSSWLCKCKCGNTIIVSTSCLLSKHTRSCGCLYRKSYAQAHKKLKGVLHTKEFRNKLLLVGFTNKKPTKANKTSRRKGVCFNKNYKRYIAYISKKGKRIYLGSFIHEIDAINARERAEKEIIKNIKEEDNHD